VDLVPGCAARLLDRDPSSAAIRIVAGIADAYCLYRRRAARSFGHFGRSSLEPIERPRGLAGSRGHDARPPDVVGLRTHGRMAASLHPKAAMAVPQWFPPSCHRSPPS
jgi:hypothetical protein